jgi:SpoVK/Ycf46/Vps4 family AAA+-type ATPase
LLFFDEADSLFGARTDVSDAHDRYANSQTNFLLQRIEEYEGVAILATNSRDRFDPAFVRRFDMVLEFPLPDAPARRRLWDCHLGEAHEISSSRLDRLAAAVDLTGGHVRNVVLAASARARAEGRMIVSTDLDAAIAEEYAKLGRTAPSLPPG